MRKSLISSIMTIMLLVLFFVSCAVNPVTGKREFMLLSQADEIAMGRQTDEEIIEMYGIYQDESLQSYINNLGRRMAPVTHQPSLPYSFKVLDTDVINAFAVPGGYVYFTRGILAYLNNEAELAGVMGHELGHVNARHSAKMLSQAQLAQFGLQLGAALSETFAKFAGLAGFGVQMLFLRFSRDHEREADNLGVEYSSKIGYDATGMATFFNTLEQMHPSGGPGLPDWFSTHPNPVNRITAVNQKTKEWQSKLPGKTFALNHDQYIKQIDGVVFGPDPRQGYVEENVFYHPTLRFQFPIPAQWQALNLPSQVQMVSPDEKGILLFTMVNATSLDEAAQQFTQNTQASVLNQSKKTIHGFNALELNSEITGDQQLRLISTFIKQGTHIYVFHGFSQPADFEGQFLSTFMSSMKGFQKLTDTRKINVKPKRIRVRTIKKSMTLNQYLIQQKTDAKDQEAIAIMNGLRSGSMLKLGSKIKIIIQ
ncbi:M48 family metalloprotease, partial [bacterium]